MILACNRRPDKLLENKRPAMWRSIPLQSLLICHIGFQIAHLTLSTVWKKIEWWTNNFIFEARSWISFRFCHFEKSKLFMMHFRRLYIYQKNTPCDCSSVSKTCFIPSLQPTVDSWSVLLLLDDRSFHMKTSSWTAKSNFQRWKLRHMSLFRLFYRKVRKMAKFVGLREEYLKNSFHSHKTRLQSRKKPYSEDSG